MLGVGSGGFDVGGVIWWRLLTRAARQHRLKGKAYRGYRLNRTPMVVEDIQTDMTVAVDLLTANRTPSQKCNTEFWARVNMQKSKPSRYMPIWIGVSCFFDNGAGSWNVYFCFALSVLV